MRIYVAGPYTKGDVVMNVRDAIHAGDALLEAGHVPFVPHLTHLWHTVSPRPWLDWIDFDLEWLRVCDGLLRLPGESKGADLEVEEAVDLGLPVYYALSDVPGVE